MIPPELQQYGINSIWRKRLAPSHFELRRVEGIHDHKVITSSHINGDREFYDYEFVDLFAPLVQDETAISFAGSGHRPEDIALGKRSLSDVRGQIFDFYVNLFKWLRCREAVSGLARGFDLWFAWAAIETDTKLIGACPFPQQARDWSEDDRAEWKAIVDFHAEVHVVSPTFWEKNGDNALYARNRWMVDRGTHLTSFWQGTRGGTAWTNDYAIKVGKPRLVINTLNGW